MTLHEMTDLHQGTPEWHDARRGIVTASVVGKLVTNERRDVVEFACPSCGATAYETCRSLVNAKPIKSTHGQRIDLANGSDTVLAVADNETSRAVTATLAAERITGWTEETGMTSDMWRGVEAEPVARDLYSSHYQQATEIGFMRLEEDWGVLGYSPDGLVGTDGLIEIKAPRAKTHLKTILTGEVPDYYMAQCQAGLLVSGRDWIDFVSYVGGMPLFVKRVLPDPRWHEAIVAAVTAFEANVAVLIDDYASKTKTMPATERIDFNHVELV